MKFLFLLTALLAPLALSVHIRKNTPLAQNVHGLNVTYTGIHRYEIEGFIGIRYALDTSNENRFRPPIPYVPAAHSTIAAAEEGPSCPQKKSKGPLGVWGTYDYITEISEDCLRLNVWRPNGTTTGDKLPVLLYIHGGSFITGNKDGILSSPGGMQLNAIRDGLEPIMNVEINYRLGIFGFAQTDALIKQKSVNAGVRDQRAAIEWVHDNIAAFGGDPDRITIHGQSSGGLAIGIQALAYGGAKPAPFQRGIAESQVLDLGITGNFSRHQTARAWSITSCGQKNLTFDSAENAECMRTIPMGELLQGELIMHTGYPRANDGDNYLPCVDGDFLPDAPSTLIAEGRFANVSMIMGWADNDAMLFTPTTITTPNKTHHFFRAYLPGFTDAHIEELLGLYPSSDFYNTYWPNGTIIQHAETYRAARMFRDLLFTCQTMLLGKQLKAAGNSVYFYDQNQTMLTPELHREGSYGFGVVHTSELIYVFGNISKFDHLGVPYHPTHEDFVLETTESNSWSSFTAGGRPSLTNHKTLQGWEEADFDDENFGTYVIGGDYGGYTGPGEDEAARQNMLLQKLGERCGFLTREDIVKEQLV